MAKLFNITKVYANSAASNSTVIGLGTAYPGFVSFAGSGAVTGDYISYSISEGANTEVGRGLYSSANNTVGRKVLISTNSNAAITFSNNALVSATVVAEDVMLSSNVTINVPADFATVNQALDFLRNTHRKQQVQAFILIANGTYTEQLNFVQEDMRWVNIQPAIMPTTYPANVAAGVFTSGSLKNWSLSIPMNPADTTAMGVAVNDYICIVPNTVPTNANVAGVYGYWKVTGVAANGQITINNTCNIAWTAGGFITPTLPTDLRIFKPPVRFTNATKCVTMTRAKSPIFRGIGFTCTTAVGSLTGTEVGIRTSNDSELNVALYDDVYGENADWTHAIFVNGFYLGIQNDASDVHGSFVVSGCGSWGMVSQPSCSITIMGVITTGCQTNGGFYSGPSGRVVLSHNIQTQSLLSLSAGNVGIGWYSAYGSNLSMFIGSSWGNGTDVFCKNNSTFTSTAGNSWGTSSPANNVVGNNNGYISVT
jgi:hypothetical protein